METRDRLLAAARRLFAERGFRNVTVREITSEASANVAAVSYHFRDKLGLYLEVLQDAIAEARRNFDAARAPESSPPEERLRYYVRANVQRMAAEAASLSWVQQLMRHEMMEPTSAMPFFVEQASVPRLRYLADIVAELSGRSPDDPQVGLHVASIHAQFIFHMKSAFRDIAFAGWGLEGLNPDRLADHIVAFTMGGIAPGAREGNHRRRNAS